MRVFLFFFSSVIQSLKLVQSTLSDTVLDDDDDFSRRHRSRRCWMFACHHVDATSVQGAFLLDVVTRQRAAMPDDDNEDLF